MLRGFVEKIPSILVKADLTTLQMHTRNLCPFWKVRRTFCNAHGSKSSTHLYYGQEDLHGIEKEKEKEKEKKSIFRRTQFSKNIPRDSSNNPRYLPPTNKHFLDECIREHRQFKRYYLESARPKKANSAINFEEFKEMEFGASEDILQPRNLKPFYSAPEKNYAASAMPSTIALDRNMAVKSTDALNDEEQANYESVRHNIPVPSYSEYLKTNPSDANLPNQQMLNAAKDMGVTPKRGYSNLLNAAKENPEISEKARKETEDRPDFPRKISSIKMKIHKNSIRCGNNRARPSSIMKTSWRYMNREYLAKTAYGRDLKKKDSKGSYKSASSLGSYKNYYNRANEETSRTSLKRPSKETSRMSLKRANEETCSSKMSLRRANEGTCSKMTLRREKEGASSKISLRRTNEEPSSKMSLRRTHSNCMHPAHTASNNANRTANLSRTSSSTTKRFQFKKDGLPSYFDYIKAQAAKNYTTAPDQETHKAGTLIDALGRAFLTKNSGSQKRDFCTFTATGLLLPRKAYPTTFRSLFNCPAYSEVLKKKQAEMALNEAKENLGTHSSKKSDGMIAKKSNKSMKVTLPIYGNKTGSRNSLSMKTHSSKKFCIPKEDPCEVVEPKKCYLPSKVRLPPFLKCSAKFKPCPIKEKCPPRADDCACLKPKKLPILEPAGCICIEPRIPDKAPSLKRLNLSVPEPPRICPNPDPCRAPRADDNLLVSPKKLKPYQPKPCDCVEPPAMLDVPLVRLKKVCEPEQKCYPVKECAKPPPCVRADDNICEKPKELPIIDAPIFPCLEPTIKDVPPIKRLNLKFPEQPRVCPKPCVCNVNCPRADDTYVKKYKPLRPIVPGNCPCVDRELVDVEFKRLKCIEDVEECVIDPCDVPQPRADFGCWEYYIPPEKPECREIKIKKPCKKTVKIKSSR